VNDERSATLSDKAERPEKKRSSAPGFAVKRAVIKSWRVFFWSNQPQKALTCFIIRFVSGPRLRLSEVLLALPAKLKEQVKAEFSKPITAILASGKPETKDDLLVREQMDRAETFELQQAFDDYCWSFKRKWSG